MTLYPSLWMARLYFTEANCTQGRPPAGHDVGGMDHEKVFTPCLSTVLNIILDHQRRKPPACARVKHGAELNDVVDYGVAA